MNPAIEATPPGPKRDKLLAIESKAGWTVERVKKGKKTVIRLLQPDSGGWSNVWEIHTEKDLFSPALLTALHWDIHGNSGLDGIIKRVFGDPS